MNLMLRRALQVCACLLVAPASVIAQTAVPFAFPYPCSVTPPVNIGSHVCSNQKYYPAAAAAAHAEGVNIDSFVVTTNGTVKDAKIVQSSGNTDLDNASIAWVTPRQFQPATQSGTPVEVIKLVRQIWRLG